MRKYFAALSFCIIGCNGGDLDKIETLSLRVDSLISEIQTKERVEAFLSRFEKVAFLRPSDQGFSTIETDIGTLTVSLENVVAYANGSRITLTLGNASSATINRLKLKIDWGSTDEKGHVVQESERSKEHTLTVGVKPGYWNRVNIVLEDVPPTKLGYVRISELEYGGVSFRTWQ